MYLMILPFIIVYSSAATVYRKYVQCLVPGSHYSSVDWEKQTDASPDEAEAALPAPPGASSSKRVCGPISGFGAGSVSAVAERGQ